MSNPWEHLDSDLAELQKLSFDARKFVSDILPHVTVALGAAAVAGGANYLAASSRMKSHKEGLLSSLNAIQGMSPDYHAKPDSFHQRFTELSLISPSVAANPRIAHKIIQSKLDTGFDLDDIHRLSAIEYHSGRSPKVGDPVSVAKYHAGSAFKNWMGAMTPAVVMGAMAPKSSDLSQMRHKINETNKQVDEANKRMADIVASNQKKFQDLASKMPPEKKALYEKIQREMFQEADKARAAAEAEKNMKKESSSGAMKVSEECLGRMLADRYTMYKTAAPVTTFFDKGVSSLKNHFQVMAPALAIAGGIHLVSQAIKSREDAKLRAQADAVFDTLKNTSDLVKSDPALAHEAFDALKSFAPSMAAKPLIARTFIEQTVSGRMLPVDTAKLLAQTEELVGKNKGSGGGFIEGLKSPMSLFSHKISTN